MTNPPTTPTCPVRGDFLGIDIGACDDPATNRAVFTCANGHTRERDICQFHADCLTEGNPEANVCAACSERGRGYVRVSLASIATIATEEPS